MKIEKVSVPVKCDMGLCRNRAEYAISFEGVPLSNRIYLCRDCLKALSAATRNAVKGSRKGNKRGNVDEER